jgi:RecB family endonuclease NucS
LFRRQKTTAKPSGNAQRIFCHDTNQSPVIFAAKKLTSDIKGLMQLERVFNARSNYMKSIIFNMSKPTTK